MDKNEESKLNLAREEGHIQGMIAAFQIVSEILDGGKNQTVRLPGAADAELQAVRKKIAALQGRA